MGIVVYKRSILSNAANRMEIDATYAEMDRWQAGTLIQDALPRATETQREFLISGMSAEEQDSFFEEE